MVERAIVEWECEGVSVHKCRVDPRSPEVSASEFKLFLFDVDADEPGLWEFLTEDGEDGSDAAADLEQPRSTLEFCAVAD